MSGLSRNDADFVDVVHTNPGALGQAKAVGHIDVYGGGGSPLQPGCFEVICSHLRAYELYAESVYPGQENNLQVIQCGSVREWEAGSCHGPAISIGYNVSLLVKGTYYMDTNSKSPFGKNAKPNFKPKCV